jgi:hypothetical protein
MISGDPTTEGASNEATNISKHMRSSRRRDLARFRGFRRSKRKGGNCYVNREGDSRRSENRSHIGPQ